MDAWKFDEEEGLQLSKSGAGALGLCIVKLRKCVLVAKNVDNLLPCKLLLFIATIETLAAAGFAKLQTDLEKVTIFKLA